jgi:hypothetical protein
MSLIGLLIVIAVLIMIFGTPHTGGRIYSGYSYGYWPGGLGLVLLLVLLYLMFNGTGHHFRF